MLAHLFGADPNEARIADLYEARITELKAEHAKVEAAQAKLTTSSEARIADLTRSSEARIADLTRSSEARIADLKQAQAKVEAAQTRLVNSNIAELVSSKSELSKFKPVICNRIMLELLLALLYPDGPKTLTDRYKELAMELLDAPKAGGTNSRLSTVAKGVLDELGGARDPQAVARDLIDLPHEVSKALHNIGGLEGRAGFYIGGNHPLGAAVGVAIVVALRRAKAEGRKSSALESIPNMVFLGDGNEVTHRIVTRTGAVVVKPSSPDSTKATGGEEAEAKKE